MHLYFLTYANIFRKITGSKPFKVADERGRRVSL